ncbi:hypothetical protein E2C01_097868 [Portunus trituberculatus]|uniref:Uncharacterized protein n=1 Tax=Portunus trituberculatus TaxID=210409 RepID=A0A5B7K1H1_PORTR|nr:hypothetical protein [Portunus trituberculatus]
MGKANSILLTDQRPRRTSLETEPQRKIRLNGHHQGDFKLTPEKINGTGLVVGSILPTSTTVSTLSAATFTAAFQTTSNDKKLAENFLTRKSDFSMPLLPGFD